MNKLAFVLLGSAFLMLGGCAKDMVASPAQTTAQNIARFQADLSTMGDRLKAYQTQQQGIMNARENDATVANANVLRVSHELALLSCADSACVFQSLQSQASDESAALLAAPAPALPTAQAWSLPTDKLAGVVTSLDKISSAPGKKADLQFLIDYGKSVNDQLNALKSKSASP